MILKVAKRIKTDDCLRVFAEVACKNSKDIAEELDVAVDLAENSPAEDISVLHT